MVQYSEPARPPITRSTLSWRSHSGQLDRTEPGDMVSVSCMGGVPPRFEIVAALVEIVDPALRIGDRRVGVGPGETDPLFGRRKDVDDDKLQIRQLVPAVPKTPPSLESLDLKAAIVHGRAPDSRGWPRKTRLPPNVCELVHNLRRIFGAGRPPSSRTSARSAGLRVFESEE